MQSLFKKPKKRKFLIKRKIFEIFIKFSKKLKLFEKKANNSSLWSSPR